MEKEQWRSSTHRRVAAGDDAGRETDKRRDDAGREDIDVK